MADAEMLGRFEEAPEGSRHVFPLRIYWEDTDAGGIVYYANYLKFTERARSDMLRGIGINQQEMMGEEGQNFVVRSCKIDYFKPAKLDDNLIVTTWITDLRGASMHMKQDVSREGELLVETSVRVACMGRDGRPQRLSSAINEKFNALLGH